MIIDPLFKFQPLNQIGRMQCEDIAGEFTELVEFIREVCPHSRETSICLTKLEEACFFAKKAISSNRANHEDQLELQIPSAGQANAQAIGGTLSAGAGFGGGESNS